VSFYLQFVLIKRGVMLLPALLDRIKVMTAKGANGVPGDSEGKVINFSHLGDRDQTDHSSLFLNHLLMFISTSFAH
jgi:hypothetical protein